MKITVETLQALSNNRLTVGVSTSWQREEYAALGVPFAERGAVLEEKITTPADAPTVLEAIQSRLQ